MSPATHIKLLGIESGKGAPRPGAEEGPVILRQRGLIDRLTGGGLVVEDLGNIPGVYETRFALNTGSGVNHLPNVLQVNRHTHACVLGTRRKAPEAFLLVIGGDHSLAIGTLAGLSDACERLGLIWIDAHADFNTPATSPTGNLHGMSLAIACGLGPLDLRLICDYDPMVEPADVHLLGLRDVDPGEAANLSASQVRRLTTEEWRAAGVVETVVAAARSLHEGGCDHVHLSFDIDVLDAACVPGTGTPVDAGLTPEEARSLLEGLGRTGIVRSAEFVEYNPGLDPDGRTAELTLSLVEALLVSPRDGIGAGG